MDTAEEVYQELIAPIEQRMMRTIACLVRDPDDAADVFQEVLMTVWQKLKRIHRNANPHGYILRMCVNASYDAIRRRARRGKREVPLEGKGQTVLSGRATETPIARQNEDVVLRAISALPAKQAKAILLRFVQGLPYPAIAHILSCSEPTVRSHVSKGKARLRTMLSDLYSLPVKGEVK